MELLQEYIVAAIMAICVGIGFIIKYSLDFIPNKYIPLILGTLGIIINIWAAGWAFTPEILLGGLASGLAATGAFEAVRNLVVKADKAGGAGGND
nr:phage holin family protein [bacterium]